MPSEPRSAAEKHETAWSETILRLTPGEHAPKGYEIKRVVGHFLEPMGAGTNSRDVYVVACRKVKP